MNRPTHPALPWRSPLPRARLAVTHTARTYPLFVLALTGVGFALRLALLHAFPLREDEAIYGYWARAAVSDPFFLHVWPDKPPLYIWLLTGAFALIGPSEVSARLVSIFASTLTIPLVAVGALRLWRSRPAALVAALLLAFNPFAVSFAPTAYTDSLLVLWGTGALVAALRGRGLATGLLLGAACMTKQQGLFYAPLVVALLLSPPLPWRPRAAKVVWALLGIALVALPVLWWDSQRWAVAPSPWALAQVTYAPLTWLSPTQWLARTQAWTPWLWYLGGSWPVWVLLGAALVVAVGLALAAGWRRPHLALMVGWGVAFVVIHVITSVQAWDRYLLPLAPWLALLASGPAALVAQRRLPEWLRGFLWILLALGLAEVVYPGLAAARGQLPIGGDHGDYAGLTAAVNWVAAQGCAESASNEFIHRDCAAPAILYHQLLGWHLRFYLYDELQPNGDTPPRFDLRWFPSAAYLADNAAKSPYPPKYLIVPDWAMPRDLALHLAMRGLAMEQQLQVGRFAVMEITQPPRPPCAWCKSTAPGFHTLPLPAAPQMSKLPTP